MAFPERSLLEGELMPFLVKLQKKKKDHLLEQEDSVLLLSLSSGVATARKEVTGQEVTPL